MKKKHEKVKIKSNIVVPIVQRHNQYGFFWYFNVSYTWGKRSICCYSYLFKFNEKIPVNLIENVDQF